MLSFHVGKELNILVSLDRKKSNVPLITPFDKICSKLILFVKKIIFDSDIHSCRCGETLTYSDGLSVWFKTDLIFRISDVKRSPA